MKLYTYFRSSAAYRVRIALNLKGLKPDFAFVHLSKDGGRHRAPDYRAINPQMRLPALTLSGGDVLIQSLAIMEYLDEVYPDPPLLPVDPIDRAHARAIAQIVACDIHPLNNSGTLNYLRGRFSCADDAIAAWYAHWVQDGFDAIEAMIDAAPFAIGREITLADVCLIPQVYNARRFKVPLAPYPKILGVEEACLRLGAFARAHPDNQIDAE